jgi:hypothetical protein
MIRFSLFGMSLLLVNLVCMAAAVERPPAVMDETETTSGRIGMSPDSAVAGVFGTWTVTFTVGAGGIAEGGGIRVQMPDVWHAGPRNSGNHLQASDPKAPHYVSAATSREATRLGCWVEHEMEYTLVKHAKPSLDGRFERYVMVVRVRAIEGNLQEGDTIRVVYGDTSGGSEGYRAGAVTATDLAAQVAVDADGDNRFQLHAQPAHFDILPGVPTTMQVHGPSQAVVGVAENVLVVLTDKENNPGNTETSVQLRCVEGRADIAQRLLIPAGRGWASCSVTPRAGGVIRIEARTEDGAFLAQSNPIMAASTMPERKVFWGELHSHSDFSWDGVGSDNFDYARYVSGLDFYAMTDHSIEPQAQGTKGLHAGVWPAYTQLTDQHHAPPAFVTLHAYEISFGTPWGHHNVFFRGRPGPLANPSLISLPELWKLLEAGNALTIPHHTGKFPKNLDFTVQDDALRRNIEIYSGHGLSEAYDPTHPLAFEQSKFTSDSRSLTTPSFAQDLWRAGLHLSTVASSDDHLAQPGKPFYGLTAVRATAPTRDAVFQALHDRRTYGTTGAKILLDFTANGHPMGSIVALKAPVTLQLSATGTDTIETVDLLVWRPSENGFSVLQQWAPGALAFNQAVVDPAYQTGSIYYMRLRQGNIIGERPVMAWSSPIWTR